MAPARPRTPGGGLHMCRLWPPGQIRKQVAQSLGAVPGQDMSEPAPGAAKLQARPWPSQVLSLPVTP